jgi:hypothetical protein
MSTATSLRFLASEHDHLNGGDVALLRRAADELELLRGACQAAKATLAGLGVDAGGRVSLIETALSQTER